MGAFCKISVLALLAAGLASNALAEPIEAVALVRTLREAPQSKVRAATRPLEAIL